MAQIFGRSANAWFLLGILLAALGIAGGALVMTGVVYSQMTTRVGLAPDQPVPFSHKHHVSGLGIDCRYCHASVEESTTAGLPPTETCMTCHSQLWTEADLLAPVRQSWAERTAIHWRRVHNLPDYAYFDHSIHVQKGVGCVACHGRVDRMPLVHQATSMRMQFCIDCHQDPAPHLRPREKVFDMGWRPPRDRRALGELLIRQYDIDVGDITHCNVCHR